MRDPRARLRWRTAVSLVAVLLSGACASSDVSSGPIAPRTIHRVEPEYPPLLRQQGVRGTVEVAGTIPKEGGHLHNLRIVRSDDTRLNQAVLEALSKWVWEPGRLDGEPIDSEFNGRFEFPPR